MNTIEAAVRQVDLLQAHERAMGRLYAAYAHRFPQDRDFWLGLSREEEEHAHWIESLQARMEQEPSILVVNRFPVEVIHHSINYINNLTDRADRADLTPIKALSAALDIERALLENRYFEVFAGDSAEVRHILQSLAQGAAAHLERVHRAWCDRQQPPRSAPSAPGAQ
jgi:hypothetical protein